MDEKRGILSVTGITKDFYLDKGLFKERAQKLRALDDVSFSLDASKTLGIVGESGSGKTTLAKVIIGLIEADSGEVSFNPDIIRNLRKDVQIIFQNPYNSLNPRMRVGELLEEPLLIHNITERKYRRERIIELLRMVGLNENALLKYPASFSGGERQRVCIARALAVEPKLVILDEPIASLDLTIQAKLLDLFLKLKSQFGFTYCFISHNLAVVRYIADEVIVMHQGRIVEGSSAKELFARPKEEYTRSLLAAARE